MRFVFAVLVVVALTGAAQAQRRGVPIATACNTDDAECREDCTMEYGASMKLREKLGRCMESCRTKRSDCTERWTELHQAGLDTSGFQTEKSKPAPEPRSTYDDAPPEEPSPRTRAAEAPARAVEAPAEEEPIRSTRTRASEAPPPAGEKKSAPVVVDEPTTLEEQEAAERRETVVEENPSRATSEAAPAPASAAAASAEKKKGSAPPPPPEPKKKDISEWDEGDIDR